VPWGDLLLRRTTKRQPSTGVPKTAAGEAKLRLDGLHVHHDRARHEQHHLVSDLDLVETRHTRIDEDLACLSVCRCEGDDALIVVEGGDRVGHLDGREVGIAARRRLRLKKYLL